MKNPLLYHSMMGGDLPPGRRQIPDQLHLAGAFQDNRVIPYEGVPASAFSPLQRRHLLQVIAAYVEPMPAGPITATLHDIERHLDETHFCWIGGGSTMNLRMGPPTSPAEIAF